MAIIPVSGSIAIAQAIKAQAIFLAWGTGDGAWTTPPTPDPEALGLQNEIGRRKPLSVDFVTPDSNGDVYIVGAGRFSVTETPTRHLLVTVNYDYEDGLGEEIRELGLFIGTVVDPSLPIGQYYFTPDQLADTGTMFHVEHIEPFTRQNGVRETFKTLVTF